MTPLVNFLRESKWTGTSGVYPCLWASALFCAVYVYLMLLLSFNLTLAPPLPRLCPASSLMSQLCVFATPPFYVSVYKHLCFFLDSDSITVISYILHCLSSVAFYVRFVFMFHFNSVYSLLAPPSCFWRSTSKHSLKMSWILQIEKNKSVQKLRHMFPFFQNVKLILLWKSAKSITAVRRGAARCGAVGRTWGSTAAALHATPNAKQSATSVTGLKCKSLWRGVSAKCVNVNTLWQRNVQTFAYDRIRSWVWGPSLLEVDSS